MFTMTKWQGRIYKDVDGKLYFMTKNKVVEYKNCTKETFVFTPIDKLSKEEYDEFLKDSQYPGY